jgi:hypothetical protein
MKEDDHIEKYGIALEDVLDSREKALKNNRIEYIDSITCPKCGNTHLEKFLLLMMIGVGRISVVGRGIVYFVISVWILLSLG